MVAPQRNEPCPCGSGRKYGECCLGETASPAVKREAPSARDVSRVPGASDPVAGLLRQAGELGGSGRPAEAAALYRQVLRLQPRQTEALYRLGLLAQGAGHLDIAADLIGGAAEVAGDVPEYAAGLGLVLCLQGRFEEAAACLERLLNRQPDHFAALGNLGNIRLDQGRLDEAEVCYRRALAHAPHLAAVHHNLAGVQFKQGRVKEAMTGFRQALALRPDFAEAHGALLFASHYRDDLAPEQRLAEHRNYAARFEAPLGPRRQPHRNARDPERRLRVGYLSPDLHAHSVAYFIEPIFTHHDRSRIEVFAYYSHARHDEVTARLQASTDHWVACGGWTNERLAERIRQDEIDILVDLAGHTHKADNRLLTFAYKPAPVQVTYLGYPSTTGLAAMDYRLCSADTDPPGQEAWHSETLYRLPRSLWCYRPRAHWPLMAASPPLLSAGVVTFGSMNNPAKVSPEACALWAEILRAVPGSRLIMTSVPEGSARDHFHARFAAHGIDPARIGFFGRLPVPEYQELLARIDLALDPFPYNGTTTTCETLWSGIPVVTLRGTVSAARSGHALLGMVGLGELVANDRDDYVRIALGLVNDAERLAALRGGLRARMEVSPLRDEAGCTRDIESAYRDMWRRWVAEGTHMEAQ